MGTSLVVQPFAGLIDLPPSHARRVLINREKVGEAENVLGVPGLGSRRGFVFDEEGSKDYFFEGNADTIVTELARLAGWQDDFEALLRDSRKKR
mmetsp:Transcript_26853/g.81281  ORF Transcript_26853/g.81281 Transcript_26853/m.81281 type:complete len:94 (-) Transcript_26853:346-627(-)